MRSAGWEVRSEKCGVGSGNWELGTGNWELAYCIPGIFACSLLYLVFGAGDRGRESILLSVVSGEIGSEWEVGFDVADEHFFVSLFAPADGLVGVGVGGIIAAVVEDGGDIDGGAFG